ncbi:MAG: hypothetical protein LC739_04310 [Actinobacteria bacterium]|nr:hypothetical protein [Actinomycetota bacterium]
MTDKNASKPIEEWSNSELLDQHRFIAAELAQETEFKKSGDNRPLDVIEEEIRRRGLAIPQGRSLDTPGRESQ